MTTWGWPNKGIQLQKSNCHMGYSVTYKISEAIIPLIFGKVPLVFCVLSDARLQGFCFISLDIFPGRELHYSPISKNLKPSCSHRGIFSCALKDMQLSRLICNVQSCLQMFIGASGLAAPNQHSQVTLKNTLTVITPANDE